jgi:polar amino acid transport system permease protein
MKEFIKQFITNKGYESVLDGLLITVEIAVFGLLIGIVIGTLIGVVRVMPKYKLLPRILDKICVFYLEIFRGTPMVVQLLIGYWVLLPALGISVNSGVPVAIIVFGMNSGAYVSEIMRGGINSVDIGQLEAGRAVGLPYSVAMLKIVIPQAVKNILPTLGNEFIVLIKETSVVSFIAVTDLYKSFKQLGDPTYDYVVPYLMLALTYLVLVLLISFGVRTLEKKLKKSER